MALATTELSILGGTGWGHRSRRATGPLSFRRCRLLSVPPDDFEPKISEAEVLDHLFDTADCVDVLGFKGRSFGYEGDSIGAFCLWECDDSPLLSKLLARWQPWRLLEERRAWLRHFRTSCDELGEFEIVARGVTVQRLDDTPPVRSPACLSR